MGTGGSGSGKKGGGGKTISAGGLTFKKGKFEQFKRTAEGFKAVEQSGYTVKYDEWWSFGVSHEGKEIVVTELSTGASVGRYAADGANDNGADADVAGVIRDFVNGTNGWTRDQWRWFEDQQERMRKAKAGR